MLWKHTKNHQIMEHVLKENPEVVVIGKGTSGMASLSDDSKALLEERGIEIIEADTPEIRDKFKGNIIVGGGIKDMDDIKLYNRQNFSGVLIGTALHDGTINIEKIRKFDQS